MIEEDPDLLRCILLLLAHGTVLKADLPLPLSPDLDPLYLTGVVEQVDENSYRLQNRIYRRFLAKHFQPGHVGHLLTMAGRWDSAIDYLEAGVDAGDRACPLRPFVSHNQLDVCLRGCASGRPLFDAWAVGQLWGGRGTSLVCATPGGPAAAGRLSRTQGQRQTVGHLRDVHRRPTAWKPRAYRQARAVRGLEGGRHVWRAIPLLNPGRKPIGVVTLCDDLSSQPPCGSARTRSAIGRAI